MAVAYTLCTCTDNFAACISCLKGHFRYKIDVEFLDSKLSRGVIEASCVV